MSWCLIYTSISCSGIQDRLFLASNDLTHSGCSLFIKNRSIWETGKTEGKKTITRTTPASWPSCSSASWERMVDPLDASAAVPSLLVFIGCADCLPFEWFSSHVDAFLRQLQLEAQNDLTARAWPSEFIIWAASRRTVSVDHWRTR